MCGGLLPGAWRGPLAVSPAVLVSAAVTEGQAGSARPVTTPAAALVLSFRLHTEPLRLHVLSVAFTEREFAWRPGPSGCQHAHWPVHLQDARASCSHAAWLPPLGARQPPLLSARVRPAGRCRRVCCLSQCAFRGPSVLRLDNVLVGGCTVASRSPVGGHSGSFHILALVSRAVVDTPGLVFVRTLVFHVLASHCFWRLKSLGHIFCLPPPGP